MTKPDFNAIAKKMLTDLRRAQHDPNDVAIAVAALRAAYAEGRKATVAEAAKLVCNFCNAGVPFTDNPRVHEINKSVHEYCFASKIRALVEQEKRSG